ncbi:Uncharacterised protein [Achromobacter denitrificans]|nr:Uncharacterised protein [Achromobacter denitrificans]
MDRFGKFMVLTAILPLTGCSALPPKSYPLFEFKEDAFDFSGVKTVPETQTKLLAQQTEYWTRMNQARRGSLDARTSVMVGATIGVVGALIRNVATTATGAGIATGGALLDQQYSLAAQDQIFNGAATRVGCVAIVSNTAREEIDDVLSLQGASYAIVAKVQTSLADLKPLMPTAGGLMEAYLGQMQARNIFGSGQANAQGLLFRAALKSCVETGQLPDYVPEPQVSPTASQLNSLAKELAQIKAQLKVIQNAMPDSK